uniref:Nuclear GTPase SLIP-GC-like n=1 Tax=Astyanax mexicanus TaxID=7994 RepID=A0A8B9L865_ASTMX
MTSVDQQLLDQLSNLGKFIEYIRENISKLNTGTAKKTTVGVFGKTGAGKSSLINAILGEKDLLPSGTLSACTSVIIQIEANTTDSNYTAEIEFISKEAWESELNTTILNVLREDAEERDNEVINTAKEKITALYGENGLSMTLENLMKDEHFSEIPEFLSERTKVKEIVCENASDLSDEIACYIQHDDSHPGECYWPVVKCVTIKVPNCKDFLEHIVLVDLPGTGDYNKSRDQMWRSKLRDCSTVWIVSEINRAGSDSDAWKLLASSISDLAQRGECRSISFICTKTDDLNAQDYMRARKLTQDNLQITPEEMCIMHRNEAAKEMMKKNFNQRHTLFKHFNCDDEFLSVYTVSSREFTKENSVLKPEQTEIPKLRDHLKKYNNSHTNDTERHYISGALGILSLIQGSKESNDAMMDEKSELYKNLEKELQKAFDPLVEYCQEIRSSLEELLLKGAKEAEEKCYAIAKKIIEPRIDGRKFGRTLTALCENDGYYRTKAGETGDLNRSLAEPMEQKIAQTFTNFFTVQETENSLLAKIDKFSFIPEVLISKNKNSPVLRHMLKFLQTEEMKLKTELKEKIIKQKKELYNIPSQCIKTTLQQGYRSAAEYSGTGAMRRKQDVLLKLIETSKSTMFQKARREMLDELYETLNFTKEIRTTLKKSMEYALRNANTLPTIDISAELEELKKL